LHRTCLQGYGHATWDSLARAPGGQQGRLSHEAIRLGAAAIRAGRLRLGPEPNQRLLELGKWLAANGASIDGTRAGPIAPQVWGVSTAKGSKDRPSGIFLQILKLDAGSPIILEEATASLTPYRFGMDTPLKLTQAAGEMALELPRDARAPVDTIAVLRPQVIGR
jgi:alpha-L-fucosidase